MKEEKLKERFIKVWGVQLWEYFQKVGHQTCSDIIFKHELDELLEQHAEVSLERLKETFVAGHDFALDCERLGTSGNINIAFNNWVSTGVIYTIKDGQFKQENDT